MHNALYAFYDLSVSPTGFDFASFMCLADAERCRSGRKRLRVIIVPTATGGFWDREPYSEMEKRRRLTELLLPLAELFDPTAMVTICGRRADAIAFVREARGAVFPWEYSITCPVEDTYQWAWVVAARLCEVELATWKAPTLAEQEVRSWLAARCPDRKVISITLREASYDRGNNADIDTWGRFAHSLDPERYCPIIVRDTEKAREPLPAALRGLVCYPEAAVNVQLRAALYEKSYLNLTVGTGPMILLWLNPRCNSIVFGLLNLANHRSTPTPLRSLGLDVGIQIPGATGRQRIAWTANTPESIAAEFHAMTGVLDRGDEPLPATEPALRVARRLRRTARLGPAAMIYRHILRVDGCAAAAFGLGLAELQAPTRARPNRAARAARWVSIGLARYATKGWHGIDEGLEVAEIFLRGGFAAKAEEVWKVVLSLDAMQPEALHGLARLAMRDGDRKRAIDLLRQATCADPYAAQAFADLGDVLAASGDRNAAREAWSRAVLYDPSQSKTKSKLAGVGLP